MKYLARSAMIVLFLQLFFINKIYTSEIKIFSGYDERQPIGTYVFIHSVKKTASSTVDFHIIDEKVLEAKGLLTAKWDDNQVSPFGRSRFLVPHLSNYEGWSLFVDGADMMVQDDIVKLWSLKDDKYSVMVVPHLDFSREHEEHTNLGKTSVIYKKFNWSSVMLINNSKCRNLTPNFVSTISYLDLHQFKWLDSEDQIGKLPLEWNYLESYSPKQEKPSLIHWTRGGPQLGKDYKNVEFADLWYQMAADMLKKPKDDIKNLYQ